MTSIRAIRADQKYRRKLNRFFREERENAHAAAIRRAVDRYARIQGSQLSPRINMIISDWFTD